MRVEQVETWSEIDVEERVVLQRRLAEAVLELEEPYRSAITLRYFEALRLLMFLVEEGAQQQAELAGRGRSAKRSPWQAGAVQLGIARRFAALTGVRVSLPSGPTRR